MFDKVAALIIKDKKLLLVRERGKNIFLLPGGKRKIGESDEQTLRRELMEELDTDIKDMNYYGTFSDRFGVIRIIAYMCDVHGAMKPGSEIEEMTWVDSSSDLRVHPATRDKILAELAREGIIK